MRGRIPRIVATALVANALKPIKAQQTSLVTFFSGWLTAELAPQLLVLNAMDTADQIRRRRDRTRDGRIDLGLSIASVVGLTTLVRRALRAGVDAHRELDVALPAGGPPRPTPWRRLANPFRTALPGVRRVADIQYGPGGKRQRLDIYHREDAPAGAPVLLQIHGGGWTVGEKHQQGVPLMMNMASLGWVCVAPNYPLSPRATWPDHLVALKRALAWMREHIAEYGGDPSFVAVTGGSAGGHLSAMLALTPNEATYQPGFEDADTSVQACVPHYGVYDLANVSGSKAAEARLHALARMMFKRDWRGDRTAFAEASPICHVRPDAPPFFVIHGRDDTLVPVSEARTFVARLRAVSASPVVYAEVHGAQHAFDIFPSVRSAHIVGAVERFLTWAHSSRATRDEQRVRELTPS